MRYADPATVFLLIEMDPDEADQDELDALDTLEASVAARIDFECQRSFGVAPVAEEREIVYDIRDDTLQYYADRVLLPNGYVFFADFYDGDRPYVTPWGMKNVTAVNVDGTWDGTIWDDQTTLAVENWRLRFRDKDGWYHGINLPTVGYNSVRVTAEWENQSSSATVPPEIVSAASMVTADEWRILHMSPAGEIGPVGLSVYLRNAWEYDMVKTAIRKNRFRQVIV